MSSKTQWLSGLYYADFINFTALLNCAEVGRRNRILTNDRFLSYSLFLFSDLLVESTDFFAVDGRTDPSSD
ncbi:MAG: hypothetical protein KH363_06090 [Streptococcus parasanguinis]|uniref:Uncharacterized protein n=1 Tax=Streptococcus parasanguinis TaxID=1318 RepID=A0A943XWL7_STRPA|nr:hypothetical protein [Streptococcus parasanguinis]